MSKDRNAIDAAELKQQIEGDAFRPLIDVILEVVGRPIQRLFRRSKPPTPWINAFIIALLITLIGLLISHFSGGVSQEGYRTLLLGGALIFFFFTIPRAVNQRTCTVVQEHLLDGLESTTDLTDLHSWFTSLASWRWPVLCGLLYVIVNILYGSIFLEGMETTKEIVLIGFPLFFIAGMMIYYLLHYLVLPGRLSRCHYRLNAFDPASSEVIIKLSDLFNYIAYMNAFLLAAIFMFATSLVTFDVSNLIIAVPMWFILIVIFIASQRSLTQIIKRKKRESLNQVETQIEVLKLEGDLSNKETMEALIRLWDYYDRIKETRTSVLAGNGIMNFINTLLIPLAGYLFSNLNNILKLLGWVE